MTGPEKQPGSLVQVVTLGCSKNLVDSEHLSRQLQAAGFDTVHTDAPVKSRYALINTCGFIHDAKQESVNTILEFIAARRAGHIEKLYVIGCLSQRYKEELQEELPEVDGFFGVNEHPRILKALGGEYREELEGERVPATPSHYAYLKISEGCSRQCAFCAIPLIRGRQRSLSVEKILQEAGYLAEKGVKELILIAQDLTSYGKDLYGKKMLPHLLEKLVCIPGLKWIRLQYTYPAGFPVEEIISLMKEHRKICRYLDIPVQHSHPDILKRMNRGHSLEEAVMIIKRFREEFPEVSVRSTLITGFPGESRAEFLHLKKFVEEMRFDRLGVFTYSHEEHTPAWRNYTDDISLRTKNYRMQSLMKLQEEISLEKNRLKAGKTVEVLIDGKNDRYYYGRTEYDSPEVDNEVLIPVDSGNAHPGRFYRVEIRNAGPYELYGQLTGK
ncbi:MAG TPA: 30S ribosomal protein S12 methylthiotransferase RimO [Bacteroidetes bacterium]|nr:30S ribosomal protein S12 methylthiotransferase RimO [Bacteroidota bacterium]